MVTTPSSETAFVKIEHLLELSARNDAYEERVQHYSAAVAYDRYPQSTSLFSWGYISIPLLFFALHFFVPNWNPFWVFVSYCGLAILAIFSISALYNNICDKREQEQKLHVIYRRVLAEEEPDAEILQTYKEEHEVLWYDIIMDYHVPSQYQTEEHLEDFLLYYKQGRVDTLGKAYTLYEDMQYKLKSLHMSERQAEALEKKNERDAARDIQDEERFLKQQAKLDSLQSEIRNTRDAVEEHNDWHRY